MEVDLFCALKKKDDDIDLGQALLSHSVAEGCNDYVTVQISEDCEGNLKDRTNLFPGKEKYCGKDIKGIVDINYCLSALAYLLYYCNFSWAIGRLGTINQKLMMTAHIWSALLVLGMFITSFTRCTCGALKLVRGTIAVLMILSGLVLGILSLKLAIVSWIPIRTVAS